jgi:8-oxo-dGTP diphosphatase
VTGTPITPDPHRLLAAARAEQINFQAVAAVIGHGETVLLLARGGDGFLDATWELPTARVRLPGDTLLDVLHRGLAHTGLDLDEVTGYLGHYDDHVDGILIRVFGFTVTVTVTEPTGMRRDPLAGHLWSRGNQLPDTTSPASQHFIRLATNAPATPQQPAPSPLAAGLRAHARGLYPAEAAAELLIDHGVWLRRDDLTARFVQHAQSPSHTDMVIIDWPAVITALDTGDLPCSSGEGRMLRLTASLEHGIPVDLRDALTGLDARNIDLIRQAVLHANGRRPVQNTR